MSGIFPKAGGFYEHSPGASTFHPPNGGLTKRELFAGLAMQSLLESDAFFNIISQESQDAGLTASEGFAKSACLYADALIAELAKERKG